MGKHRKDILDEDLIKLRKKGMSYKEICEYYMKKGIKVSYNTIYDRLRFKKIIIDNDLEESEGVKNTTNPIYTGKGKEKSAEEKKRVKRNISLDDRVKEILLTGESVKVYCTKEECQDQEYEICNRIRRLKIIAECSIKQGDRWIPDNNFLEVIRILESTQNLYPGEKYQVYLKPYMNGRLYKLGSTNTILRNVFRNNTDLMIYILSSNNSRVQGEYDIKFYKQLKEKYKAKIDKYFNRLHAVEENAKNKAKSNNNEKAKKGINNPNQGDER